MNANGGNVPSQRKRFGDACANQQGANQAGTFGISNRVDLVRLGLGLRQDLINHRKAFSNMVSGCQLRYDTAIGFMDINLAIQKIGH